MEKTCCKKWKEANIIEVKKDTDILSHTDWVFPEDLVECPECGSSLEDSQYSKQHLAEAEEENRPIVGINKIKPKQESKREIDKELLEILRWFAGKIRYLSADVDIGESITEKEFWEAVTKYSEEVNITMQKRKSKWCECVGGYVVYSGILTQEQIEELPCQICGKRVKPKLKLPEKIDPQKWAKLANQSSFVGFADFSYIDRLIRKYNDLIGYIKHYEEENQDLREEIDQLERREP